MITLGWLTAIALCLAFHWTNGLLALIAVFLLECGLRVGRIQSGVTNLCQMLKDDDVSVDETIRQMDAIVKQQTFVIHKAPLDWMAQWTKES